MQLNKHNTKSRTNNIKEKLALATCTLLQAATPTAQAADDDWEIKSALMIYSESDSRVTAIEPVVSAKKEIAEDEFFTVKLVLDSLTGAMHHLRYRLSLHPRAINPILCSPMKPRWMIHSMIAAWRLAPAGTCR